MRTNRGGSAPDGHQHVCNDGYSRGADLQAPIDLPDPMNDRARRKVFAQLIRNFNPTDPSIEILGLKNQVPMVRGKVLNHKMVHIKHDNARGHCDRRPLVNINFEQVRQAFGASSE